MENWFSNPFSLPTSRPLAGCLQSWIGVVGLDLCTRWSGLGGRSSRVWGGGGGGGRRSCINPWYRMYLRKQINDELIFTLLSLLIVFNYYFVFRALCTEVLRRCAKGSLDTKIRPSVAPPGGTQGTFPSPKLKRNCCRKVMLFPKALFLATTFPKIGKNVIFLWNFMKNFQKFLMRFPTICVFRPNARKINAGFVKFCVK